MSEERTLKEYDELEENGNGAVFRIIARMLQGFVGLTGGGNTFLSFLEHGFNLETVLSAGFTIGIISYIESQIRKDAQETHDMYHEPGVVEY